MRIHRFPLLFVLALMLLGGASIAGQGDSAGPTAAPPLQVIATEPAGGAELSGSAPVVFFFNQPIDCDSAVRAFLVQPSIDGSLSCEAAANTVTFTPAEPYIPATRYVFAFDPALRSTAGGQLLDPFTLELSAVGELRVSDFLPAAESEGIAPDALITVIFNRPVVPLTTYAAMAAMPAPIVIDPPVEGEGEWLNTSIYVFRPAALAGGAQYTVSVNPDLVAVDGARLSEAASWTFTTEAPRVVEVQPTDLAQGVLLTAPISATFNMPVDRDSAEAAFSLAPESDLDALVEGTFTWSDDGRTFTFTPSDRLAIETLYTATVAPGVTALGGGQPLAEAYTWTFSTVPLPAVLSTQPFDGQRDVYPYGGFTITFASPMNIETLRERILIDPEPWLDFDAYFSTFNNSYTLAFPTEPSTDYTITLLPGMEDIYGNAIETELVVRYRTAPYEPEVMLQAPRYIGFYNAFNPQTRVFLTHRNVSQVDITLSRVALPALIEAATGDQYFDPLRAMPADAFELMTTWTIPSTAPPDRRRYELLDLGLAAASQCPGAPPARLAIGDIAIVITEPDPLRARSAPPDGTVVDQLYRGYRLPIVDGPVCANQINWWQVRLRDGRLAWVAEGITEEYFLDVAVPAGEMPIEVAEPAGGPLAPGLYRLQASAPQLPDEVWARVDHLMVVGTANLVLKSGGDSVLVWATNVNTGEVLAGQPIAIYDQTGLVAQGVTDDDGLLVLDVPPLPEYGSRRRLAVLQSDDHFGLASDDWASGIEPYQFGLSQSYERPAYSTYLYTDRPIYRPDQPVYFRGILRARDDVTYTLPMVDEVNVAIFNPQGEIIWSDTLPLTPFGSFSGQFAISPDAELGYYRLAVQQPDEVDLVAWRSPSIPFGVAEYRAPEFQVELTPEADAVVNGETIRVLVESRFFFGGAVSGGALEYVVVADPYFFQRPGGSRGYSFIDTNADYGPSDFYYYGGGQIASGAGTLDENGRFLIELPAELGDSTQSQQFTIEATVTEESGQAVSARASVIVHKGELYVGVRPERYVGTAGESLAMELIAVDWDGAPIANQPLTIEVFERRWSSVQELDEFGRSTWTYAVEDIPVTDGSATTDARGEAVYSFTPPVGGIYKVLASTRDTSGNTVVASTLVYVSSGEFVAWRQENSNRITLVADAESYSVGDTAQILIPSPFQGAVEALITVERDSVLLYERVTLETNSTIYELPILPEYAPNVFVSVVLVRGVDENNPVAAFRAGLIGLAVDNEQKALTIEVTPDVEQAGPGDEITYTVQTTNYLGEPVVAEVGIGLTDLSVLTLAEPNSIPLLLHFYGPQALGVQTATPLTINTDLITQTTLDTIKGGGGGFGEGGIFDIREEFIDTVYWNPALVTDANGTATFTVTLPDNLTTWRLDARAVTSGEDGLTLVGQTTFDVISTKPLLIRPVTPRFFVVGDRVVLAAIINNNTESALNVRAALQASGVTLLDEAVQTITVPADGRQRVEWPVTVDDVAAVDLTFFVDGGDGLTDASKPPLGRGDARLLPVLRFTVPETVGTGGVLREAGSVTEAIVLPPTLNITQGELTIRLEPSLAATTIDGLTYLENFPHQCVEQTVSRFLPNVMTYRALEALGLADETLRAQLTANVSNGVQRLLAQQKVSGGWGWFVNDEPNPLVTAYALIGLAEAQRQGFDVPASAIEAAQRYLRQALIVPTARTTTWQLNRQAFVLYALARSGAPSIAQTTTLFEYRSRLHYDALALLALTFAQIDPDDTRSSDVLVSDLINAASLSATGAHWNEASRDYWNWNSDTRTTALALAALVELRPDSDLIPNVVRYLMAQRTADAWETTQETAWSIMALTDWMLVSGDLQPEYSFSAELNSETLAEGMAAAETAREALALHIEAAGLLAQEANLLTIRRGEGPGSLYYTAHLRAFLPVPMVEPLSRGLTVERRYFMPSADQLGEPVATARVGDTLMVRLTIVAPNDLHYVVVEDPIPAGTDAIDPMLQTSQQIGTQSAFDLADPLQRGWGYWLFTTTEFRDDRVVLYAPYLPAGTYEFVYSIRAGLPGVFNVLPATGYEFYFPEVYGRSAGSTFTIEPAN